MLRSFLLFLGVGYTVHAFHLQHSKHGFQTGRENLQLSMIIEKDEGDSSTASKPPARVVEKKVVVIGGGWAGFTAADSLSTCLGGSDGTIKVELLDASPRGPGGLAGGWRTPKLQRPVEAGIHGFWREYRNTFATIERIGLKLEDVLTEYTPSILVSQSGRVALAPVLGEAASTASASTSSDAKRQEYTRSPFPLPRGLEDLTNPNSAFLSLIKEELPPPLDVALFSEFNADNPLSIVDRISALGLLGVWADFEQESKESWERYDGISAENLFRSIAGLSPNLYQELVSPLLHVLPMTPGYDCSAAAALSCFHVFALQSKGAFDVRWCRGTISEKIFNPWAAQLQSRGNVKIRGSAKVTAIEEIDGKYVVTIGDSESIECDAVVMAVGGTALKRLLPSSPPLAKLKMADGWKKFRGVTCVAVRLFFRPSQTSTGLPRSIEMAMKDSPVVVCGPNVGNIPQLAETGFCIYDLQRLQDEFKNSEESRQGTEPCVAVEVDYFRADDIAKLEDNMEIAKLTLRTIAAALNVEPINPDMILDVSVVRARDAVSHFCVGSASWSPNVKLEKGLYMCGDWVDRTGHASWSTEKAVVTGRQAAEELATDFGMKTTAPAVIPASSDTAQLASLRQASKLFRTVAPTDVIPPAPWVLLRQISGGRIQ